MNQTTDSLTHVATTMSSLFPRRRRRRRQQSQQERANCASNNNKNDNDDIIASGDGGGGGSPVSTPRVTSSYSSSIITASHPPQLRRAGSSTYSSFVSLVSLQENNGSDSDDGSFLPKEQLDSLQYQLEMTDFSSIASPSTASLATKSVIFHTLWHQLQGMAGNDFCQSGLPWSGTEQCCCRSVWAGGSGILYALPALTSTINPLEQCRWILQAVLSVLADYVHINDTSFVHGLDRWYATYNTVRMLWQCAQYLHPCMLLLAIVPISCFVLANGAKKSKELRQWQWYHGGWHVTGSVAVAFAVFATHQCVEGNGESLSWGVCR